MINKFVKKSLVNNFRNRLLYVFIIILIVVAGSLFPSASHQAHAAMDWIPVGSQIGENAGYESLVVDASGTPYVAYANASNNGPIIVNKFDGSNWVQVGSPMGGNTSFPISFAIDASDTPYLAYSDGNNSYAATVEKFDGSNWVQVGLAMGGNTNAGISIVIDASNTPYLAYVDGSNSNTPVVVQKFDGSNWVPVGSAIGKNIYNSISLAINVSSTPYLAYTDSNNNYAATVEKFDGSNWVQVGLAMGGNANALSLVVNSSGTPYLAYSDGNNNLAATVQKFDGSNWVQVGSAMSEYTNYDSLILDASNTPYLAYNDYDSNYAATVEKFDGSNWVQLGSSLGSNTYSTSLSINASGILYLVYGDTNNYVATVNEYPLHVPAISLSTSSLNYTAYLNATSTNEGKQNVSLSNLGGAVLNWTAVSSESWLTFDQSSGTLSSGSSTNIGFIVDPSLFSDGTYNATATIADPNAVNSPQTISVEVLIGQPIISLSSWVPVGSFLGDNIISESVAIDASGTPYLAYADGNNNYAATVQKFDGSNWVQVGSSLGKYALFKSITIDASGTPYLAYTDGNNNYAATVQKFDGSNWVSVGSPMGGNTTYESITIDASGTPYLAYTDGNNNNAATVQKFDGIEWIPVGSPFSKNTQFESIVIDASGTPYLAYSDGNNKHAATVQKFDGIEWIPVGSPFSVNPQSESIAIDVSGTPYLAYNDVNNNNVSTVQKYVIHSSSLNYVVPQDATSTNEGEQYVPLSDIGRATLNWTITSSEPWLTIDQLSGTLSSESSTNIGFMVDPTSFSSGIYNATATIADPNAENSSQTISVTVAIISPPTATPGTGTYSSGQSVTLLSSGATSINYTTDGTTPTCSSQEFSSAISVPSSETINAVSCYPNNMSSTVSSFTYTISSPIVSGWGSSGGGSGGGASSIYNLSINGNSTTTTSSNVTLSLYGTGANTMEISNTSSFSSSTWISYVTSMPWTLIGTGEQTLYVRYRNSSNNIVGSVQASINLILFSSPTTIITSTSTPTSTPITITTSTPIVSSTSSMNLSQMEALLASLESQLQSLQTKNSSSTTTSYVFTRNLYIGMTGNDVRELQIFLIKENTGHSARALASHGLTKIFGSLTKSALIEFQKSVGIVPSSGYFGQITRAYVNAHD